MNWFPNIDRTWTMKYWEYWFSRIEDLVSCLNNSNSERSIFLRWQLQVWFLRINQFTRGNVEWYTTFLINQNILVCQGTSLCSVQCIWSQRIHFLVFFALAKVCVLADLILILNQYGCNLVGEYGCNLVVVLSMCLSSTVHEKTDIQQCSFDITTLIYWEQNKDV